MRLPLIYSASELIEAQQKRNEGGRSIFTLNDFSNQNPEINREMMKKTENFDVPCASEA